MTADITTTTAAVDLQTMIARGLIVYTMPNLVLGQIGTPIEGEFDIGQTYDLNTLTRIAATAGSATTETATSFTAPTETSVALTINKIYYGAFRLPQMVDAITTHDWGTLYDQSIRDGLKVIVDAQLATLVAGFTQTVGTINNPLTDDNMRRAVQYLDDADAPMTDRAGAISPAEKNDKLSLERWSSADYIPGDNSVTREGVFKRQYGVDWMVTTNLTSDSSGHDSLLAHKDGYIFAIRREAGAETFDLNNPAVLSRDYALTVIFGFVKKRDTFCVWLKSQ